MIIYVLLFLNFAFTVFVFVRSINVERRISRLATQRHSSLICGLEYEKTKLETSLEDFKKSTQSELADIKFNLGQTNGRK